MRNWDVAIRVTFAVTVFGASAFADDCAPVKSALLNSGTTPHSVIVTKFDDHGKQVVTRQIQTLDNKYVQTADGKWYAMNIGIKDLDKDTSGVLTCIRSGSESVAGEATTVYEVHGNLDGEVQDQKMWVSSNNRIVKTEGTLQGARYKTEYDFSHMTPPASAISMGGK